MATFDRTGWGLIEHRRWEDIVTMILGVAILVSPMFGDTAGNTTMVATTAIVGAAIVVLGALEQIFLRRWEEFLTLLLGVWMMSSPFVLEYAGTLRNWHIALGAAVAVLALLEIWQDRNRDLEA
jgi:SPW repeat